MYTGGMIDELIENVQQAEQHAFVRVTQAKKISNPPAFATYIYEFGRRQAFEVA